ncbi:cation channel sperm-associated protein subunit delta [Gracilinanus agilis]|uniref:cation channel sperm-associated protein subunit delta n=1 Tax=Gracilinanus agilis TaxID=191870 RepID=UPI001CFE1D14|nr:cation channel sperm-associated protein subunit delta [Gracilinanus agilis]
MQLNPLLQFWGFNWFPAVLLLVPITGGHNVSDKGANTDVFCARRLVGFRAKPAPKGVGEPKTWASPRVPRPGLSIVGRHLTDAKGLRLHDLFNTGAFVFFPPFCHRQYIARTGKIHYVETGGQEDLLFYAYEKPVILKHPCRYQIALFLGKTVFLTTDTFESSLKPLFAPKHLQGRFVFANFPEQENWGLPFPMDDSYKIINLPGLKGFLIFWNDNNIQFSHNSGQLVGSIAVKKNMQFLHNSIAQMRVKIYNVASHDNELAILTENGRFFYGTLGLLSTSIFEVTPEDISINNTALMFRNVGFIFVVTPIQDPVFQAYDFHVCIINIQKLLYQSEIGLKTCKAEVLQGNFDKKMHILDMGDTLYLYGVMVPQPTQSPIPIITVSNPHSLGIKLKMYEDGYTYDGNIQFKINITLMQQYLSGKAHDSFISNIKVPSLSTITLDLIDRGLSCIDLQPPTGLISIGCNWAKRIIVRNSLNACSKDILTPVELQQNYTYLLEKETYDPSFNSRSRNDIPDQSIMYDYEELGCPQLVYFNNPWKPVIELWEGSQFVEVVTTEFVLIEKNGIHTYNYSVNVGQAACKSQAQNWTTVMDASATKNFQAWTRDIYVTCHELNASIPLLWPHLEYQILGGRTDNSIIFHERNGFYIFSLTIVDPFYSYCDLTTSFAIYVYGAFPQRVLPDYPLASLTMFGMLFMLWLGYVLPKLSSTEKGKVIVGFFQQLWRPSVKKEKRRKPAHH